MQDDRRQHIDMDLRKFLHTDGLFHFPVQTAGTEERMIHKVSELIRRGRLACQHIQHLFFRYAIVSAQFFRNVIRQYAGDAVKVSLIDLLKLFLRLFAKLRQCISIMIGNIQTSFAAGLPVDFKIRHHLFKRQFKRIADIMEQ